MKLGLMNVKLNTSKLYQKACHFVVRCKIYPGILYVMKKLPHRVALSHVPHYAIHDNPRRLWLHALIILIGDKTLTLLEMHAKLKHTSQ